MAAPAVRSAAAAGLLVLIVSLVSGAADAPAGGPRTAVDRFYGVYLRHRGGASVPTGDLLERLTPLLSERLRAQLVAAHAYREGWIARHASDEKPPLTDGDLFSSLFEGPKSYRVGRASRDGDGWRVQVRFRYEDSRWEDAVIVRKEDGRFVIDDVVYGGAGEFNPAGRLSETLASALKDPD